MDIQDTLKQEAGLSSPTDKSLFCRPDGLGLHPTMTMVAAPIGKTFHYRGEDKRVIEHGWTDEYRLRKVEGPIVYAVADGARTVRYFGRHLARTPIYSRWFRHGYIHHQRASRNRYLAELDTGRGQLTMWSASVRELRSLLPREHQGMTDEQLATNLEACWVRRWMPQLWNTQTPPMSPNFDDGSYWVTA